MTLNINIKQIGSRKPVISAVPFEYPGDIRTVGELITETVHLCVAAYNCRVREGTDKPKPLTDEQISDMASVGRIAFGLNYGGREQDLQPAIDNALQSYEDGLFRIFVGEKEVGGLAENIELHDGDMLSFIRLTMLTGRLW